MSVEKTDLVNNKLNQMEPRDSLEDKEKEAGLEGWVK